MKVQANGSEFVFTIEGAISEGSELFLYDIRTAKRLVLDLEKLTYINSVGIKHWIMWTVKIPSGCIVELVKCPIVIVNQVINVKGFLPPTARIQSFYAPYVNDDGDEQMMFLERGKQYEYAQNGNAAINQIPESYLDPKDAKEYEADFIVERISNILTAQ